MNYNNEYFCITNISDSINELFIYQYDNTAINVDVEYSFDKINWYSLGTTGQDTLYIEFEDKIYLRAITNSWFYNVINCSKEHNVSGNIMSLILGSNFINETPYSYENQFYRLFNENVELVNAKDLILTPTTLCSCCYTYMFRSCYKLITTPSLPAQNLDTNCYRAMFINCSSLITAPELPATILANQCYYSMFRNCTSLINAPQLNAKKCLYSCYTHMFNGCTSLVNAPKLPSTKLHYGCYAYMFYGCTSLINAPVLPALTLKQFCYSNMFYGCTSLVNAPNLLANELMQGSYRQMFDGCTNLRYIKCTAIKTTAANCLYWWVNGVSDTGTFIKSSANENIQTGINGIPEGWTVETVNNYISDVIIIDDEEEEEDYPIDFFTIENIGGSSNTLIITGIKEFISPAVSEINFYQNVYYSFNKENWIKVIVPLGESRTINFTNKIYLVANNNFNTVLGAESIFDNNRWSYNYTDNVWGTIKFYYTLDCSNDFNVSGNIMSLVNARRNKDNVWEFNKQLNDKSNCFYKLFENSTKLKSVENIFPKKSKNNPYYKMFYNCSNLNSVIIPSSIKNNDNLLIKCHNLNSIILYSPTPSKNLLNLIKTSTANIYVPSAAVNTYKNSLPGYENKIFASNTKEITSLSISVESIELEKTSTYKINIMTTPYDVPNSEITFTSSDEGIVEIYQNGIIRGAKVGRAVITASYNNMEDTLIVDVIIKANPEYYASTDYSKDGEIVCLQQATVGKGINLIFLGNGFVDRDMETGGKYEQRMIEAMEQFFIYEPYKTFRNRFNIYTVKVVSKNAEIEADSCNAFSYTEDGEHYSNQEKALEYARLVPNPNNCPLRVAILYNSISRDYRSYCTMWTNGQCVCFASYPGPVLNHEFGGHGFGHLADEYYNEYPSMSESKKKSIKNYQTKYGLYLNIDFTDDPNTVLWSHFLQDDRYEDEELSIIEGAFTYATGAYRSSVNSMMNTNTVPFNAPSRELIYKRIMKESENNFVYDYETFAQVDAAGREQAAHKLINPDDGIILRGPRRPQPNYEHVPPIFMDDVDEELL